MTWLNIGRAAKVVALLAFLLPWMAVSCNGTLVAEASGLDLVTGGVRALNERVSEDREPQWWAIGALALIVLGLVLSFALRPARRASASLGGAAVGALVLCAVGMMLMIGSIRSEMAEELGGPDMPADAQPTIDAIRIDTKCGYWLTLLALAGAASAGFMAFSGRSLASLADGQSAKAPVDPDIACWDSIDRTDRAALEEYIHRFPDGRFVELARLRLAADPPQA